MILLLKIKKENVVNKKICFLIIPYLKYVEANPQGDVKLGQQKVGKDLKEDGKNVDKKKKGCC